MKKLRPNKTKMNNYFSLILIGIISITSVIGQSVEISDNLKLNIESRFTSDDLKGIIIQGTKGDTSILYMNGVRSLKTQELIDAQTVFEIGSISKTFTGLMLADLVVRGKVNLDDDIQLFLPDGIQAPTRNGKTIKLYHLSNHTSGLPRMPDNFAPADNINPFNDYTEEQMYEALHNAKLTRDIGSVYEYSNFAAGLLGHIVAKINEKTYEELLTTSITQPLGMLHTSVTLAKGPLAKGHMGNTEMPNWDFASLQGAGAIRSTSDDMVRYLLANMGITKNALYPTMQLAHKNSGGADSNPKVGLGWHKMNYDEKEIIWHNGATGGYTSFMGWIKGTDIGVVVLNNSNENVDDIGLHMLVPSFPLKEIQKAVEVDASVLERYIGQYALAPSFILTVSKEGNQLMVQATGQAKLEVYPKSETTFFYKVVDAQLEFKIDENGIAESVTLFQAGQALLGKKVE